MTGVRPGCRLLDVAQRPQLLEFFRRDRLCLPISGHRLNQHWFLDLENARTKIEHWRNDCNMFRPHRTIGDLAPLEFLLSGAEATG